MPVERDHVLQPEQIKLLWVAFDAAWRLVKEQYASSPEAEDVGRLRLATAVMRAYRNGITDSEAIKEQALGSMRSWALRDEFMSS